MELRAPRRLAPARLGLAVAVGSGLLVLLLIGGAFAWQSARHWLHGREPYRGDFLAIELVPPPPPWIKPGREGLLKAMLARAGRLEPRHSTLDLDLQTLDGTFLQHCPWIESVKQVERSYPNRVRVRVRRYREPVATLAVEGAGASIVLDANGVVLPAEELDWDAAGPLLLLRRLPTIEEARVGLVLKLKGDDPERHGVTGPARLAGFLKAQARGPKVVPPSPIVRAIAVQEDAVRKDVVSLWLQLADGAWVLWDDPPGEESPGNVQALRKWDLLRKWLGVHGGKPPSKPQYLHVSEDRVEILGRAAGRREDSR